MKKAVKRALLAMTVLIGGIYATQAFATPIVLCNSDHTQCCAIFDNGQVACN